MSSIDTLTESERLAYLFRKLSQNKPGYDECLPIVKSLLLSAHDGIRKQARVLTERIPIDHSKKILIPLVGDMYVDTVKFAAAQLGKHKEYSALPKLKQLLASEKNPLFLAAIQGIEKYDDTTIVPIITGQLKNKDPYRIEQAILSLSRMSCYKKAGLISPLITHKNELISTAALKFGFIKWPKKALKIGLANYTFETPTKLLKIFISNIANHLTKPGVKAIILYATEHPDPLIQIHCKWELNTLNGEKISNYIISLLKEFTDGQKRLCFELLNYFEHPNRGRVFKNYLNEKPHSQDVVSAALEAMGNSQQTKYLHLTEAFIKHEDYMYAYLGVLASCQLAEQDISTAKNLVELLESDNPEHEVFQEVILQFLNEDYTRLINVDSLGPIITRFLDSPVDNLRLLSVELIHIHKLTSFLPKILLLSFEDEESTIQTESMKTTARLLDKVHEPLYTFLTHNTYAPEVILRILSYLKHDKASTVPLADYLLTLNLSLEQEPLLLSILKQIYTHNTSLSIELATPAEVTDLNKVALSYLLPRIKELTITNQNILIEFTFAQGSVEQLKTLNNIMNFKTFNWITPLATKRYVTTTDAIVQTELKGIIQEVVNT